MGDIPKPPRCRGLAWKRDYFGIQLPALRAQWARARRRHLHPRAFPYRRCERPDFIGTEAIRCLLHVNRRLITGRHPPAP